MKSEPISTARFMSLVPAVGGGMLRGGEEGCSLAKGGRVQLHWDRGGDDEEDAVVKLGTMGTT